MAISAAYSGIQVRRVILWLTVVLGSLSVVYEMSLGDRPLSAGALRSLLPAALVAVAWWELLHDLRTEKLMTIILMAYGLTGVLDQINGSEVSRFGPGTTLALLILVSIMAVSTRTRHETSAPIVGLMLFVAGFSVATVVLNDFSVNQSIGILLVGGPGQALTLWMVHRLIKNLNDASALQAKHARIQRALARCSEALLHRGTEDPLKTALEALLDATEAHYAYVDVNHNEADGRVTWEIVADATGPDYPSPDGAFLTGDYEQLGEVAERMKEGKPSTVITARLAEPLKSAYESEGVKAELIAPIRMGGHWVGTIGYTDHRREGTWTDVEVEGVMRAAEMVGAYWEREAAREGLMELAQAKDRFIASVSHELRTPLTGVVGFAAELMRGVDGFGVEEIRELASLIFDQSVEVTQLVDDLLTAERAASGNLTVKPAAINLVEECRDIVLATMGSRLVDVQGDEVTVWADGLRTRQIVRNLLTNAIKYGGERVEVRVAGDGDVARLVVRDDGRGVNGVEAERIFDPYYRAQETHTKPDSVGLGLAVARQLAQLMGGDLTYRRKGEWTCFELTLPISPQPSLALAE